jgi:hypothetical protein
MPLPETVAKHDHTIVRGGKILLQEATAQKRIYAQERKEPFADICCDESFRPLIRLEVRIDGAICSHFLKNLLLRADILEIRISEIQLGGTQESGEEIVSGNRKLQLHQAA